jgi:hypothetical protein
MKRIDPKKSFNKEIQQFRSLSRRSIRPRSRRGNRRSNITLAKKGVSTYANISKQQTLTKTLTKTKTRSTALKNGTYLSNGKNAWKDR